MLNLAYYSGSGFSQPTWIKNAVYAYFGQSKVLINCLGSWGQSLILLVYIITYKYSIETHSNYRSLCIQYCQTICIALYQCYCAV